MKQIVGFYTGFVPTIVYINLELTKELEQRKHASHTKNSVGTKTKTSDQLYNDVG